MLTRAISRFVAKQAPRFCQRKRGPWQIWPRKPSCAGLRTTLPRKRGILWSRPCMGDTWRKAGRRRQPPR
eukprot:6442471-Pyramimonas_sp.AAC.1